MFSNFFAQSSFQKSYRNIGKTAKKVPTVPKTLHF